jgi:Methyltransferase domain
MERRDKLITGLDLRHGVGIEIGPLDRPVVTKQDGEILYVDHADTASIRGKYQGNSDVNIASIVNVDAVWGTQTLQQAIGPARNVDYIIASHVIEHVPDIITWLDELRAVLKPRGQVRLAVPDRRFTFDYLRRETSLADILNSYLLRARKPLPISILDFCLNVARVNSVDAWEHRVDPSRLKPSYTVDGAISIARDSLENGNYHDVHCWVFTPESFADLFAKAGEIGLIRFACGAFHDTEQYEMEFFVTLSVCDDPVEVVRSWRHMAQAVAHPQTACACRAGLATPEPKLKARLEHLEVLAAEQTALLKKLVERNSGELENLQRKLDSLYQSTSWRLTGPFRAAVDFVRRQGKSAGMFCGLLKQ